MEEPIGGRAVVETPILRVGILHLVEALVEELDRRESLSDVIDVQITLQPLSKAELVQSGMLAP